MIGVAITTRDRPEVFARTRQAFVKYPPPPGSRVVVVDDASSPPVAGADFRFDRPAGIPAAKNKCLQLLSGCSHLFLFDDDTRPIAHRWWAPYCELLFAHAMFLFHGPSGWSPRRETMREDGMFAFDKPRGCMLYFRRAAIEAVGGADPAYGPWGYWHVDLSDRIHAAGLTPAPYCDVDGSDRLFECDDAQLGARSSVPVSVRSRAATENLKLYESHRGRTTYIPYATP